MKHHRLPAQNSHCSQDKYHAGLAMHSTFHLYKHRFRHSISWRH